MINVYSINEILEASNNILNSSAESKVVLSSDKNELVNKKNISVIEDKTLSIKSDVVKENTFNVLEKIILEAESSPLNINNKLDDRIEHIDEKNLLEQNTISQKKLIEELYKTYEKKTLHPRRCVDVFCSRNDSSNGPEMMTKPCSVIGNGPEMIQMVPE